MGPDTALGKLKSELERLDGAQLSQPRVQIRHVLADARALSGSVEPSRVRLKLVSTGLPSQRLEALAMAIEALEQAESRLIRARCPDGSHAKILEKALVLRERMLAACVWNLRRCEVSSELARISDGTAWDELVIDLRELAALLEEYEEHFFGDRSFSPGENAREALRLAEDLSELGEHLDMKNVAPEVVELRDRAFTYLVDLVEEIRAAGSYAFREGPEAQAFATDLVARRARSILDSLVPEE
jgi:hypothetical protein